jgi:hypothetical protein
VLQHPQLTLSILDPTSLLGREVLENLTQAFPGARCKLFHTLGVEEHLIAEVADEATLVPPFSEPEDLGGSDAVVVTSTPNPPVAAALVGWLRANPQVLMVDASQPGIAPDEAVSVLSAPPPGRSEARWYHLVDPNLFGPARFLAALAPLRPQACHLTMMLPASTFGVEALEELAAQGAARLSGRQPKRPVHLSAVLAFDLLCADEARRRTLANQVAALFGDLDCHLHLVEAGIFHGHVATALVRCGERVSQTRLSALLRRTPGLRLARKNERPRPSDVVGNDGVICSDLRIEGPWVAAWLAADGLHLGGAHAVLEILSSLRAS